MAVSWPALKEWPVITYMLPLKGMETEKINAVWQEAMQKYVGCQDMLGAQCHPCSVGTSQPTASCGQTSRWFN